MRINKKRRPHGQVFFLAKRALRSWITSFLQRLKTFTEADQSSALTRKQMAEYTGADTVLIGRRLPPIYTMIGAM